MVGISVVIPAFGRQEALLRAIQSVQARDLDKTEIVVIDDGSPVSLEPAVPSVNRHGIPVRFYRLARNAGPQAARNLGMRRASHDYIAFLDSDDEFLPGKIDQVRAKLGGQGYDVLFHPVEGQRSYALIGAFWDRHLRRWLPFEWLLALLNPVVTPALVFRRNGRLGAPRLRYSEDWAFLLHAVTPGSRVAFLAEPLARVHRPVGSAGGQSAQRWAMRKGEFVARSILLRDGGWRNHLRFAVGTAGGALRVVADLARLRYFRASRT